jgi:hypothetical protein
MANLQLSYHYESTLLLSFILKVKTNRSEKLPFRMHQETRENQCLHAVVHSEKPVALLPNAINPWDEIGPEEMDCEESLVDGG